MISLQKTLIVLGLLITSQLPTASAQCVVLSRQGYLSHNDPVGRVRFNCHYDTHTVYLQAGCPYTIDLTGCFDTYLRVESGCGCHVLAENDDGGHGLNSRIYFTPTRSGIYRLLTTSYRQGDTGNYHLTVRR